MRKMRNSECGLRCRYVLCNSCKSPDTLLDRDSATRIMFLRCQQVKQAQPLYPVVQLLYLLTRVSLLHLLIKVQLCKMRLPACQCLVARLLMNFCYHAVWRLPNSGSHQGWFRCQDLSPHQDLAVRLHASCRL